MKGQCCRPPRESSRSFAEDRFASVGHGEVPNVLEFRTPAQPTLENSGQSRASPIKLSSELHDESVNVLPSIRRRNRGHETGVRPLLGTGEASGIPILGSLESARHGGFVCPGALACKLPENSLLPAVSFFGPFSSFRSLLEFDVNIYR